MSSTFPSQVKSTFVTSPAPSNQKITSTEWNGLITSMHSMYHVDNYGAVGDWNGSTGTDNTTSIQDALTAAGSGGGGTVYLGNTNGYRITGVLVVPPKVSIFGLGSGEIFEGAGLHTSGANLVQTTPSSPTLRIIGGAIGTRNVRFNDVTISYVAQGTAGGNAVELLGGNSYVRVKNLVVIRPYSGIVISGNGTNANDFDSIYVFGSANAGIQVDGTVGGAPHITNKFTNLTIDGGTPGGAGSTSTGLIVSGSIESIYVSNAEIINQLDGIAISSTGSHGTFDAEPMWCRFNNLVVDGNSRYGLDINKMVMAGFSNCIFTSNGSTGVRLQNVDEVIFSNCSSMRNGQHGWHLSTGAQRVRLIGCSGIGNSVITGNTYDGAHIDAGISDFVIQGGYYANTFSTNAMTSNQQRYGVRVDSGASDRYIIANNLVSTNSSAGINDNGSGVNKLVANNF
jgi:hypothetical protein